MLLLLLWINNFNFRELFWLIGIFAVAQVVLPKDCKGNKFCEIMKMIVGPTIKWYITGHFEWKKIRIATGFANVRIQDGLYFHKLELYVEVLVERLLTLCSFKSFYVDCSIRFTKIFFYTFDFRRTGMIQK